MHTIKLEKGGDKKMDIKMLVGWVLVIGAVNWGLVGLLNMNLVESLFGAGSTLTTLVYALVGLTGVYKAYMMLTNTKK